MVAFRVTLDEITWDIHGSKPFTSIEGMKSIVCPTPAEQHIDFDTVQRVSKTLRSFERIRPSVTKPPFLESNQVLSSHQDIVAPGHYGGLRENPRVPARGLRGVRGVS
jgi:hypothetical protein